MLCKLKKAIETDNKHYRPVNVDIAMRSSNVPARLSKWVDKEFGMKSRLVICQFDLIVWKGGSLKRSLGMVSGVLTIPIPINEIGMRLPPNHRETIYKFMFDKLSVLYSLQITACHRTA